jgi:predicted O-methyltransferase YrrM
MEWGLEYCGIKMSSNYYTLDVISRVLTLNSHIKRIIEIGTYTGSLSIYLGLEGIRIGTPVYTFDIKRQHNQITNCIFNSLGIEFNEMDVFAHREQLFELFDEPLFILCDGGIKSSEFAMVVPKLKSGSIVCVHDYSTEFLDSHWEPYTEYVQPIMKDEWMKHDTRLAIFKIK